jgi:uncharacterized protein YdeI (BOF family)
MIIYKLDFNLSKINQYGDDMKKYVTIIAAITLGSFFMVNVSHAAYSVAGHEQMLSVNQLQHDAHNDDSFALTGHILRQNVDHKSYEFQDEKSKEVVTLIIPYECFKRGSGITAKTMVKVTGVVHQKEGNVAIYEVDTVQAS